MHMSDALLSPVVGGAFWATSAGLIGISARKIATESDGSRTVLMGVLGAFVFAAQMINFSIPGTGSSGHIGGGLLLAVLLGPWRAFVTLSSVLVIQALFFADGGLLSLGCNIFNLAFFPAFIMMPLIYKPIAGDGSSGGRLAVGCILAAAAGLLAGALSVVLETTTSGISDLPFRTFVLFMLPIHLAIGAIEGLLTWGVLSFVLRTEPALLAEARKTTGSSSRFVPLVFLFAALATGGILSWFASKDPDGLEWSIAKVTGKQELASPSGASSELLGGLQRKLAFMPGYGFRHPEGSGSPTAADASHLNAETSVSGLLGSILVLVVSGAAGLILRKHSEKSATC